MVQSYFRGLLSFLLLFTATLLQAQLQDDFSDGDLDNNPSWIGTKSDFVVSGERLQLNATTGGKSYLSVRADWLDTASWEFYAKLDFAPSTSNQLDVYLSFDKADLTADGEGYFLRIGKSGTEDNLELYKKSGSSITKLGEGAISTLGASTNEVRIRVTRSKKGDFEIQADFLGASNFALDFKATDASINEGAYFGFSCRYTSTRADKFLFDDVRIDPIFKDLVAPDFYQVNVIDTRTLQLLFDEELENSSSTNTANYDLNGATPIMATLNFANPVEVYLEFSSDLVSGTMYTLTVDGVKDLVGNTVVADAETFNYFKAQLGDVIINEIFPDPTPTKGLPEEEFVELYNRSGADINLQGWSIADATGATTLPSVVLKNGEYLILCSEDAAADYGAYGQVATLSLPSLNNTGDDVVLRTENDELIDRIGYDDSWYNDIDRALGGYSIERINSESVCSGKNNWAATTSDIGGTPGTQNAVFDNSPDVTAPELDRFEDISTSTFDFYFTEPFDSLSAAKAEYEVIGVGNASKRVVSMAEEKVTVTFTNPLEQNIFYDLKIEGIEDCEGNRLSTTYEDGLIYLRGEKAGLRDILITEIFADPTPVLGLPEAEYIELQNVSERVLDMGGERLWAGKEVVRLPEHILFPGDIVVLCDAGDVQLFEAYDNVLGVSGFPGLNNGGELITLRSEYFYLIHFVDYSDSWYDNEEAKGGGYSLEMIDTENPCTQNNNWTAAKNGVYGTPGTTNSQAGNNPDVEGPFVEAIGVVDNRHLLVTFNETTDSSDLTNSDRYSFPENNDYEVVFFFDTDVPYKSAILQLNNPLERNKEYRLKIREMQDCEGNFSGDVEEVFALPETPYKEAVVVNEILFNPETGGADFVELYNRTDEYFDLKDFALSNRGEDGELGTVYTLSTQGYLLAPNDYVVLSVDKVDIESRYEVCFSEKLLELPTLPTMPDAEGEVVLLALADSTVIDEIAYDADWHYTLLEDDDGYSLERIDPEAATQSRGNWHTASSASGGATPTYRNSQYRTPRTQASTVALSGESFSPDNDGFDDFVQISIQSETLSQSVSIGVYNLSGQRVRNLVPHDVLGDKSVYQWNGFTDLEERAPIGVYIFLIEVVDLESGTTERFKESVVLAGRI